MRVRRDLYAVLRAAGITHEVLVLDDNSTDITGVVLAGGNMERLKTLRAEIEGDGGDAHVVALDVTDLDSIKSAVAHAETEMGTIDILVNNSGVSTSQKLTEVTEDDYDFVFDTNTRGAFFVAQEVGKRMLARAKGSAPGTFTGGRIVNIASMAGLKVLSKIGVYSMSKAAVIHMTRGTGPLYRQVKRELQRLIETLPRKRIGQPQDLDSVLMMLCANESHFINGAVIQADDGYAL